MVVGGGVVRTLVFEKKGYLTVQRQIDPGYQQDLPLDDVILRSVDLQSSVVAVDAPFMQVARGSVQVDQDGSRQATMLFAPNTSATITVPQGNGAPLVQPLNGSMTVRATEFTVGLNGPAMMPANLPPTTAYTYAVELSVDEALAAGATRVDFNQPVAFYLDNFLGMPVGIQVPLGIYDRENGKWIPEADGRVIQIIGTDANGAVIDSGSTPLVLSAAERIQLSALYPVGKSLWRVELHHFSIADLNFGPIPPIDACAPDDEKCPLGAGPETPRPEDDACQQSGSIIECENQILGERIPIAGTPYTLNYRSDRAFGRKDAYSISIPATGPNDLPPSLKTIAVRLEVAGRSFGVNLNCAGGVCNNEKNKRVDLPPWDGKDAQGRILHGAQSAKVSVGYQYDADYAVASASQSFGGPTYTVSSGVSGRTDITLWKHWYTTLGAYSAEALGLGGFTVDRHHVYDSIDRVLYRGDGSRVSARARQPVLERVVGNLSGTPDSVAVAADGSIVFIDPAPACVVRRVKKDGTIEVIAGKIGNCGYAGDGLDATNSNVYLQPIAASTADDGSVYIVEQASHVIRHVTPDHRLRTIAGNGSAGPTKENVLATTTHLSAPSAVAAGPNGDVYLINGLTVYRVAPGGMLTRLAGGSPSPRIIQDGMAATDISFNAPSALAVAPDGAIYIADNSNHAVYRVGTDGLIRMIATVSNPSDLAVAADGTIYVTERQTNQRPVIKTIATDGLAAPFAGRPETTSCTACGLGGPALAASFSVIRGLAATPDGGVIVAEAGGNPNQILRIRPSMPFVSAGGNRIMSESGSETYDFDSAGRHLSTRDARTGAILESFEYDPQSRRLTAITDLNGLSTHIEHDPQSHAPTQIMGPFNHVTTLGVDGEGYLNHIENPENEHFDMTYYPGSGLLHTWRDPKQQTHTFEYDFSTGRLIKDSNPAGGFKNLVTLPISGGYQVNLTTALNRKTSYRVTKSPQGVKIREVQSPSTLTATATTSAAGTQTTTFPDQTTVTMTPTGDPRFGLQAPIAASETTQMGPLTRTVERTREVTMNPNQPTELAEQIDRAIINGLTFRTTYTKATNQEVTVTPENRQITRAFDAKGRIASERLGSLEPVEYTYNSDGLVERMQWGTRVWGLEYDNRGQLSAVTDPLLHRTEFGTDNAGRLTSETNPLLQTTTLGYDANGNPTHVTPAGRPVHEMTYSPLDQMATYTAPAPSVNGAPSQTSWGYDLDGALDTTTLPDNSIVDETPDSAGRLRTRTLPGTEGTLTFDYDPTTGHLHSLSGPKNENLSFGYNSRLLTDQTWQSTGITVHHNHDNFLRVVEETINGQHSAAFSYDNDGILISAGASTLHRNAQTGQLDGSTAGFVEDVYERNTHGEVTRYTVRVNGAVVMDVQTPRDALGRIDSRIETISGQTSVVDYVYDAAGRLEDVIGSTGTTHYDYDANGNRLGRTNASGTETGAYDAQDRLETYAGRTYTYTTRGALESMTDGNAVTTYQYDAVGGLRQVVKPNNVTIAYEVDGMGRRVWKLRNGQRVQGFVYADALRPVAELDGNGNIVARFIYGRHVNVPDLMVKNGRTYRIVTDHLGSVRFVVDTATGAIAQAMTYDEYGRVLNDTAPGFQPFGFAGGLYDAETELVRFGARDYDAFTGRWTAKDPIGFDATGYNLYAYALGDPMNLKDANGLLPHSAHVITPEEWDEIREIERRMNITPEAPILPQDAKCVTACFLVASGGFLAAAKVPHVAAKIGGVVVGVTAILVANSAICQEEPMTNTYTPLNQ